MSYSFFVEMAWKSAAISGAALLLVALLRSRSAADRGALLRVGIVMLLLLPLVSLFFPALVVETPVPAGSAPVAAPVASAASAAAGEMAPIVWATAESLPPAAESAAGLASGDWNDPGILFFLLYVGGLIMVGGRLAAGLATLARWTKAATEVDCPAWRNALRRVAPDREIRLLVSAEAKSPLSWGWRRPAILIDPDTLRRPEDADAILAHEVAHIVRGDWLSLIGSRLAVAFFWFNPLVWRLDREVAQQAEEAADSYAAERVEPSHYAQTLLDWARLGNGRIPANAMAGSEHAIARRIRALLDGRAHRRSGSFWTFAAMAACAAVAAPVAALEFVPEAPEAPEAPSAPQPPAAPEELAAVPVPAAPAMRAAVPAAPAPAVPPAPELAPGAMAPPQPPRIDSLTALAFAPRHPAPIVDGKAIEAEVQAAVAEAMRSVAAIRIDGERISAEAERATKAAMAGSAQGMMAGADGMERGADKMREEAAKLRDRDYRERAIAKAAREGKTVTHEELLDAARGLEEGAEGMREGAREMREAAREMARGG
jgi:beta-lactamase regulating signal transducer with metallopeptidase domain